ncbi:PucR family transcriptional regulator [Nocardioides humilatus]|uniref:PucR family transcriptional regulator n=1 Tax=Nocardioides humilatus TaxID=2607660 RepID=UPI00165FEE15|nr:PucR family transcriptional regulator [Nocardioides humilatus]
MLTVARVLAERALALQPVHLADGDRPVAWVATSELADPTPFLQGNEVLLTTGLDTTGWGREWDAYVARLVAADVAALGLGIGLTHASVPRPLAKACAKHGLTLFTVPRPTAFVTISRAVAALLDEEAEHATRQALEAQRLLTRAALRGQDADVLRQLARLVGGRVEVVDAAGADTALARAGGTTVVHPLGLAARPTAWLAVTTDHPLPDPHRSAISTAVALLTLADEGRRERRTHDRVVRARAVGLLLDGDAEVATLLLDAVGTALPPAPVRVLCVRTGRVEDALEILDDLGVIAARDDDLTVAICAARRATAVATRLTEAGATVGIGTATRLDEAARSHETAVQALARTSAAAPARAWDELHDSGVVALLGAAATPYSREWLAPLADDTTLIETLSAYVAHHGSIGAVAAALGVHRNTVRNRVAHIEALLGRDLAEAGTRAEAWVALSALEQGR